MRKRHYDHHIQAISIHIACQTELFILVLDKKNWNSIEWKLFCSKIQVFFGRHTQNLRMDQTNKPQRNARPTVKLGDIDFTAVYIALLVVLISISMYPFELSQTVNRSCLNWYRFFIRGDNSSLLLMEKEITKAHRSAADWSLRVGQNVDLLTAAAQRSTWNVHLNHRECGRIHDGRDWSRTPGHR